MTATLENSLTDEELIAEFESGALSLEAFHHADHVRMGFAYVRRYSLLVALDRFSAALQRFAAAHGKETLYHETITWAYLFLIHERIARAGQPQGWEQFARTNSDLLTWKDGVLDRYYSKRSLQSELARRVFIFPDKLA
jgi:hypothetical protein